MSLWVLLWDVKLFNLKLPMYIVMKVHLSMSRVECKLDFLDYQLDSKLLHVYTQKRWSFICVHSWMWSYGVQAYPEEGGRNYMEVIYVQRLA